MREIVLDTETTGLEPEAGHRIVEIAGMELVNGVRTGKDYQTYLNPERDMPEEAFRVHGLSEDFLRDKPRFAEVAEELLAFLGDARLVIHNAAFDLKFLNAELTRLGHRPLSPARAVDTVALARAKYPGAQVSLDALCRRLGIDNSARSLHGAFLDCELLSEVYLELSGGRQPGFDLDRRESAQPVAAVKRPVRPARPHAPTAEELRSHAAMLETLSDPIWAR
ncbi:MAG: DNA polymerase III subunit epsilon [Kiloniellales bacterium]|nr:DNA polymerase III subunit epsilon [Kiloniellales bacterium]